MVLAKVILVLSCFTILSVGTGAGFSSLRLLPPFAGFAIALLGGISGLSVLLLLIFPLLRNEMAEVSWVSFPAAAVGVGFIIFVVNALRYPAVNDISTDTSEPPQFSPVQLPDQNRGRSLDYPAASAKAQHEAFPEIGPLESTLPTDELFPAVLKLVQVQPRWTVRSIDSSARRIECEVKSPIFGFTDDVVLEIRQEGGRAFVHVRSRSRVGRSDLGANARRISEFLGALERTLSNTGSAISE